MTRRRERRRIRRINRRRSHLLAPPAPLSFLLPFHN